MTSIGNFGYHANQPAFGSTKRAEVLGRVGNVTYVGVSDYPIRAVNSVE